MKNTIHTGVAQVAHEQHTQQHAFNVMILETIALSDAQGSMDGSEVKAFETEYKVQVDRTKIEQHVQEKLNGLNTPNINTLIENKELYMVTHDLEGDPSATYGLIIHTEAMEYLQENKDYITGAFDGNTPNNKHFEDMVHMIETKGKEVKYLGEEAPIGLLRIDSIQEIKKYKHMIETIHVEILDQI